ncbi:M56 family metallopeptidase [Sphingomonas mesophila]|uniref:M56 family metallopeptidase n=1 Tax=Sphingomonas mesophila TaxID=2303576 RepID=UPI000E56BCDA|nr:M56 family metallopeptidase [Sphingomonas mesophila]
MSVLLALALKSLVVAGGGLFVLWLARHRSAADRSLIAHLGLAAVLLLPLGQILFPPLAVAGPDILIQETTALSTPPPAEAFPADLAATPDVVPSPLDPALLIYLLPALLLAGLTLVALTRLVILKSRATVVVEPRWTLALAQAQSRMGFKHGTALLLSDELPSPISWGVVRPVILLNREAAGAHGQAEAIIAHELAHVAHLDWAKLLVARVAIALFWFNPLVWLLAREAHQLREEAADDAVLGADIADTDYAELLIGVARHECRGLMLGAHGVAPARNSLARRVRRVLDGALERAPGGWRWTSAAAFFAAGMAVPLAALTVVPGGVVTAAPAYAATPVAAAPQTAPTSAEPENRLNDVLTTSVSQSVANVGEPAPSQAPIDRPSSVVDANGNAILTGPDGMTLIASADGTATVLSNGRAVATARADGTSVVYNDNRIDRAITRRAAGVDADYARSIASALPGIRVSENQLVRLKTLGITREYIRAMNAVGYRRLSVDKLVELRALRIAPSDVVRTRQAIGRLPTPDEMVRMRALGIEDSDLDPNPDPDPDG